MSGQAADFFVSGLKTFLRAMYPNINPIEFQRKEKTVRMHTVAFRVWAELPTNVLLDILKSIIAELTRRRRERREEKTIKRIHSTPAKSDQNSGDWMQRRREVGIIAAHFSLALSLFFFSSLLLSCSSMYSSSFPYIAPTDTGRNGGGVKLFWLARKTSVLEPVVIGAVSMTSALYTLCASFIA